MGRFFTAEDIWTGFNYELAIELGPRSDERLVAASEALWRHESLDGPYAERDREPAEQERVSPALVVPHEPGWIGFLYGVATLPDGARVACCSTVVRDDEPPVDWLDLSLPEGALDHVYGIDWSAGETGNWETWRHWLEPLDAWFAGIAQSIYAEVPFALALIGEEIGAVSDSVTAAGLEAGDPRDDAVSMLVPEDDGLEWRPRTVWDLRGRRDRATDAVRRVLGRKRR